MRLLKLVRGTEKRDGVLARHRLFDLLACVYDVVSLSTSVNLYY